MRDPDLPPTELPNLRSADLDRLSPHGIVELMLREEADAVGRLPRRAGAIAGIAEAAAASLRSGGRLVYVGAGTSGRLGVLDAVECVPTFRCDPSMVVGIIAGGHTALMRAVEGAEDDAEAARAALDRLAVSRKDTVVGIAACGQTPFVLGALEEAKRREAQTALITAGTVHLPPPIEACIDTTVVLEVGPEVLTGSTRLKAGTATKIVLNAISTTAMIRLGKVYRNLMVDLKPTNEKLRRRAVRLVCELAGVEPDRARLTLAASAWEVKTAVLALRSSRSPAEARSLLGSCGGFLGRALDEAGA
jgi:N-acetylmuramic acid 6-phosphate etherase